MPRLSTHLVLEAPVVKQNHSSETTAGSTRQQLTLTLHSRVWTCLCVCSLASLWACLWRQIASLLHRRNTNVARGIHCSTGNAVGQAVGQHQCEVPLPRPELDDSGPPGQWEQPHPLHIAYGRDRGRSRVHRNDVFLSFRRINTLIRSIPSFAAIPVSCIHTLSPHFSLTDD